MSDVVKNLSSLDIKYAELRACQQWRATQGSQFICQICLSCCFVPTDSYSILEETHNHTNLSCISENICTWMHMIYTYIHLSILIPPESFQSIKIVYPWLANSCHERLQHLPRGSLTCPPLSNAWSGCVIPALSQRKGSSWTLSTSKLVILPGVPSVRPSRNEDVHCIDLHCVVRMPGNAWERGGRPTSRPSNSGCSGVSLMLQYMIGGSESSCTSEIACIEPTSMVIIAMSRIYAWDRDFGEVMYRSFAMINLQQNATAQLPSTSKVRAPWAKLEICRNQQASWTSGWMDWIQALRG